MTYNPNYPANNETIANLPLAIRTVGADIKELVDNHTSDKQNPHNVTLSQLGAAPDGFGIGGPSKRLPDNTDLNSIINTGFYDGTSLTNAPTTDWNYLLVQRHSGDTSANRWISQVAINFNTGNIYRRVSTGGTGAWTSWRALAFSDNSGNADTLDGKHASDLVAATDVVTTPAANKLLRLDGMAKLPASITGDAATVSGMRITYGTFAPSSPQNSKELWIDTTNRVIKIFESGVWITIGAAYSA